jgi:hypothetical protein
MAMAIEYGYFNIGMKLFRVRLILAIHRLKVAMAIVNGYFMQRKKNR